MSNEPGKPDRDTAHVAARERERRPALSVVVPLFNEEENVAPLLDAIEQALAEERPDDYEILFVDDGSRDGTFEKARALAATRPHLKLIRFRRNFGQTPAMAAGIDHARGTVIVTMDGDLQNDPRDIVNLTREIAGGADIAVGWRFDRQDKLITRKIPSRIANWLIGKVTGVPIKDNGCSLKAYRAEVIKHVPLYSEMHRFIPAMSSIAGARIKEIKVRHHARKFGSSKYGLSRIYKVLFDLLGIKTIISFAARPIQGFGILAAPLVLASLVLLALIVHRTLTTPDEALIILSGLTVICGASAGFLLMCGVLGELIFRTGEIRPVQFSRLTAIKDL
jgi:glycosyltransferase involved in cell wall biosynthesis